MMIFCGPEESHKSGCRDSFVFSTPVEKQGEDWLPYAIYSHEAFVPVTEMTVCSDLAPCLVEIKAGTTPQGRGMNVY